MSFSAENNIEPAATHPVFNQASALENYNLFNNDKPLQDWLKHFEGTISQAALQEHGRVCGSAEAIQWGFDANEQPPRFDSHDRFGHRIDQIHFHPAYHSLMALALKRGIPSMPWRNDGANHVVRAAYNYMQNQLEPGHACPLTMTFASVPTLKLTPDIADVWLLKVLAQDYQPDNIPYFEKSAVTIGMGMTEKQGGSDVRANTSLASSVAKRGPGQLYSLTGHKWFLSAPMCDAFLMLAKTEAGLSCFLVPRWRQDGSKNPLLIQRLKNKMGNVSNASSEVEMRGAHGWLIGQEGRGVAAIIEMVSLTRFDCMIGSTAGQRQAVIQAVHHARYRQAFGSRLIDKPLMQNVLADLQLEVEGSLAMSMRIARALDKEEDEHEQQLLRLGTAVGKYWICKRTPGHAYEAMECLGGNGVVENSVMPRLYREAPINAIWEGSGNIQALDVLRVMQKSPLAIEVWLAEIAACKGDLPELDEALCDLKKALSNHSEMEYRARDILNRLALCFQLAVLLKGGDPKVAEAFARSRLAAPAPVYGSLPIGLDVEHILNRVLGSVEASSPTALPRNLSPD